MFFSNDHCRLLITITNSSGTQIQTYDSASDWIIAEEVWAVDYTFLSSDHITVTLTFVQITDSNNPAAVYEARLYSLVRPLDVRVLSTK